MKVTSAGIIRNEDKPRTGVVSVHSLADWFLDDVGLWVDLGYVQAEMDTRLELKAEHPEADDDELDDLVSDAMERYESGYGTTYLVGSWIRTGDQWEVDHNGEFAATYNTDSGNICVEWSKHTVRTHHTSPCYVMSDGSGPCGDLDTPGDSVLTYTLPPNYFSR